MMENKRPERYVILDGHMENYRDAVTSYVEIMGAVGLDDKAQDKAGEILALTLDLALAEARRVARDDLMPKMPQ